MGRPVGTVEISCSPKELWDFIADFENTPYWMEGVKEVRLISRGRELGEGARCRVSQKIPGRPAEVEIAVTTWDPPHRYAFTEFEGGFHTTYGYRIFPLADGRTLVELTVGCASLRRGRLLSSMLERVFAWMARHQLERLRLAIERHGKRYGPLRVVS